MTKIKLLSIAVVGLLLVNIGIISFLVLHKPMPARGGPPPMENAGPKYIIIKKLQFDKAQAAQYETLIEQHQAVIKLLVDSINICKNELYNTLNSENEIEKDSLIIKLGNLQKQVEISHFDHFASIKKLCKPDQLKNYTSLTKELARFFAPARKDGPPPRKD